VANPAYLAADKAAQTGVLVSVQSEDAIYPKENLQDAITAKLFRGSSLTDQWIEYDFGTSVTLDVWGIANHNLSASVSATLRAGATTAPSTLIHTFTYRAADIYGSFTPASHRFWRLTISDSLAEAISIGWMPVGELVTLPVAPRYGGESGLEERTIEEETQAGVDWVFRQFQRRVETYPFRFRHLYRADFETLHNAVGGRSAPMMWIPDSANPDVIFGRKEAGFALREIPSPAIIDNAGGIEPVYDYELQIRADSRGLNVGL